MDSTPPLKNCHSERSRPIFSSALLLFTLSLEGQSVYLRSEDLCAIARILRDESLFRPSARLPRVVIPSLLAACPPWRAGKRSEGSWLACRLTSIDGIISALEESPPH